MKPPSILKIAALLLGVAVLIVLQIDRLSVAAQDRLVESATTLFMPLIHSDPVPVVVNGSFQSGDFAGWTLEADAGFTAAVVDVGSDRVALLGSPDADCNGGAPRGGAVRLYQPLTVPSGTDPVLSMRYRVLSQDDQRFETLGVYINDVNGVPLDQVLQAGAPVPGTLCGNPAWDSGWQEQRFSLSSYQGQTVQLYVELRSVDDTSYFNTWAFVDDFTVLQSTPTPTATASPTTTPSATSTGTSSPTATPPGATATHTPSPVSSLTPTNTPQATSTPQPGTPTVTATPTATETQTRTATPTATSTSTSTPTAMPTATSASTSTPTATQVPTTTPAPTASSTVEPTFSPTPPFSLHVGDLDGFASQDSGPEWQANITVTIHDSLHLPLTGATVVGRWSNGHSGDAECTTNASGTCTVDTGDTIPKREQSVDFTGEMVTRQGYDYRPGDNHDPDGDSDGTTIRLYR